MNNDNLKTKVDRSYTEDSISTNREIFQRKNKFGKFFYSICVGIMASLVLILDFFIAPLFVSHGSFVWVAFINWTLFSSSSFVEKIKALGGYITGFLCANGIVILGSNLSSKFNLSSISFPVGASIATFLVNFLVMRYGVSKKMITSIPSIFLGIALTFSGLGVNMPSNSLSTILIIVTYGAIGLLCCIGCDFCAKKFLNNK